MTTVSIGIQVRLASSRLAEKSIYELVDKMIVNHLLDRVFNCIHWISQKDTNDFLKFNVFLLTPMIEKDFWEKHVSKYNEANNTNLKIISGSMDDVLSRYSAMCDECSSDFIVRLTGDCPLIPAALISKIINIAINRRMDYISNVGELRTMPDGYDVEVLSMRMFGWLETNRVEMSKSDLEHVTSFISRCRPSWAKIGLMTANIDQSAIKYSVDTIEDFERINKLFSSKLEKEAYAKRMGIAFYEY